MERWWGNKYNLPASDPRFTTKSLSEHAADLFQDLANEVRDLTEAVSDMAQAKSRVTNDKRRRMLQNILDGIDPKDEHEEMLALVKAMREGIPREHIGKSPYDLKLPK